MKVWHHGCHKEPKALIVVNVSITKSHLLDATTGVEGLLQENRVNRWVNVFLFIFDKDGATVFDTTTLLTLEVVLAELH